MSFLRQRQRIPPNGKIRVNLSPEQRNLILGTGAIPKDLGHLLHRAPVRGNKLEIRLGRRSLQALTAAILTIPAVNQDAQRALDTLVRYLEDLEDRFVEPEQLEAEPGPVNEP